MADNEKISQVSGQAAYQEPGKQVVTQVSAQAAYQEPGKQVVTQVSAQVAYLEAELVKSMFLVIPF